MVATSSAYSPSPQQPCIIQSEQKRANQGSKPCDSLTCGDAGQAMRTSRIAQAMVNPSWSIFISIVEGTLREHNICPRHKTSDRRLMISGGLFSPFSIDQILIS
jgi:hypothetical protein